MDGSGRFCAVVNCMDGMVQIPVINFLKARLEVDFVDSITEPGPVRILAERADDGILDSILHRLRVSIEKHGSEAVAVVGHHDCTGNPAPDAAQKRHIKKAVCFLQDIFPDRKILALWVDSQWQVSELAV